MQDRTVIDTSSLTRIPVVDPITFSVIVSRFDAIANEMTIVLERSAWTAIIALAHDYSCAIYDNRSRQISMHDAIPIHTTSMNLIIEEICTRFSGDIHDRDIFICNDPYSNNTHIGDLFAATPLFHEDELLFWSVTRAHHLDVGAVVPASVSIAPKNVWEEGLTIPPLRLASRGVIHQDLLRLFLANVRYASLIEGDLHAQMGSIIRGRERLAELVAEYGRDELMRYVEAILDYADRRMSQEIRSIPDGVYEAEGWIDSDGYDGFNIPIRVTVEVRDDQVQVDFAGSGPQGPGGVNGTLATSIAAGTIPFLYYIDPDIPHNDGCLRHVHVNVPRGTICCAEYPGSTSTATIVPSSLMQDVVNRAMTSAIPDRVAAGGARAQNTKEIAGEKGADGLPWALLLLNNSAGFGAAAGQDGWPLCYATVVMGCGKTTSVERFEMLYPVVMEAWEIECDSMGAGQWIGGPGSRLAIRPTTDDRVVVSGSGDGCDNPPHGAMGGTPGFGGGQFVEVVATGERRYISSGGAVRLAGSTERWVGISSGGGGFGRPCDRDVEEVRQDVRDGIVSRKRAYDEHGVLVSDDVDPVVDDQATATRRKLLDRLSRPTIDPDRPNASTWRTANQRDGDVYLVNPKL